MQEQVTMTVETKAAHGGIYLVDTAVALTTVADPGDDRAEAAYKAVVAMDTNGNLQLVWWTNGDDSFLTEDGYGVLAEALKAWSGEVGNLANDRESWNDLAEYIAAAARAVFLAAASKAADEYYLANTKKNYDELKDLSYASNWFPNAYGDEWETELEAIGCGEEIAQQAIDEEAE